MHIHLPARAFYKMNLTFVTFFAGFLALVHAAPITTLQPVIQEEHASVNSTIESLHVGSFKNKTFIYDGGDQGYQGNSSFKYQERGNIQVSSRSFYVGPPGFSSKNTSVFVGERYIHFIKSGNGGNSSHTHQRRRTMRNHHGSSPLKRPNPKNLEEILYLRHPSWIATLKTLQGRQHGGQRRDTIVNSNIPVSSETATENKTSVPFGRYLLDMIEKNYLAKSFLNYPSSKIRINNESLESYAKRFDPIAMKEYFSGIEFARYAHSNQSNAGVPNQGHRGHVYEGGSGQCTQSPTDRKPEMFNKVCSKVKIYHYGPPLSI